MKEGETIVVYIVQVWSKLNGMSRIESVYTNAKQAKEFLRENNKFGNAEEYWVTSAPTEPHKEQA
jgi:hypothetical protein